MSETVTPTSKHVRFLTYEAGYPQDRNSCWIDTSLQVIFHAINSDWPSFVRSFDKGRDIGLKHPIQQLFTFFQRRHELEAAIDQEDGESDPGASVSKLVSQIAAQRDSFRHLLWENGALVPESKEYDYQNVIVRVSFLAKVSLN